MRTQFGGFVVPFSVVEHSDGTYGVGDAIGDMIVMNLKEKEFANAIAAIPDMVDFIRLLYRSMPEAHDRIAFFGTETEQLLRTLRKP